MIIYKLQDGTERLLGDAKFKVKCTPTGQAYLKEIGSKEEKQEASFELPIIPFEDMKLGIIVPPISSDTTIVETGEQKHLLVACHKSEHSNSTLVAGLGYLTSKSTGAPLHSEQYKTFEQKQLDSEYLPTKTKKQFFNGFEHIKIIPFSEIKAVLFSDMYIKTLPKDSLKILGKHYGELTKKTAEKFNNDGITKEKLINICKKHDDNVKFKKPHPLTADQIKQTELGKQKQKEIQEKKKKEKEIKNNENNDETNTTT